MALTQERTNELRLLLKRMQAVADSYYVLAQSAGHHQFIEFTGFLNEYIKICKMALEKGRDFENNEVEIERYHADYIGDKLGCIFGGQISVEYVPRMKKTKLDQEYQV